MTLGGTSFVTVASAATMAFSPIVTPDNIVVFAPIQAFFFTQIGATRSPRLFFGLTKWLTSQVLLPGQLRHYLQS